MGFNDWKKKQEGNPSNTDKIGVNTKKMTPEEIGELFGDANWHQSGKKTKLLKKYEKQLKGDSNADFLVDKSTGEVFLKGNVSKVIVKTDLIFK